MLRSGSSRQASSWAAWPGLARKSRWQQSGKMPGGGLGGRCVSPLCCVWLGGSGMRTPCRVHSSWKTLSPSMLQGWRQDGQAGRWLCARRLATHPKCSGCRQIGHVKIGSAAGSAKANGAGRVPRGHPGCC